MFTILGALAGLIIDVIIIVAIALGIIALPFVLLGKLFDWIFHRN